MATNYFHLAQINVARMLAPLDDPQMADFVAQLDAVNTLADQSDGFVWRLQSESGNATEIQVFENELILVNMSVWESVKALRRYTYHSQHANVFRARRQWFRPLKPSLALWWVPVGHVPTVAEGKARLEMLARRGPTADAFTFKQIFAAPGDSPL